MNPETINIEDIINLLRCIAILGIGLYCKNNKFLYLWKFIYSLIRLSAGDILPTNLEGRTNTK